MKEAEEEESGRGKWGRGKGGKGLITANYRTAKGPAMAGLFYSRRLYAGRAIPCASRKCAKAHGYSESRERERYLSKPTRIPALSLIRDLIGT